MPMYYWEGPGRGCGRFKARNDFVALKIKPSDCIFMYKENDTINGLPFVIVFSTKQEDMKPCGDNN